jgi:hypothetical protein
MRRLSSEAAGLDLVYLDPPFKSNQNYNVLFQELDGTRSKAQVKAFNDTWVWDDEARAEGADEFPLFKSR